MDIDEDGSTRIVAGPNHDEKTDADKLVEEAINCIGKSEADKGIKLLTQAVELGHVGAMFELGNALRVGLPGVSFNAAKAAALYQRAASQKHLLSCASLGMMYGMGSGVPQSYADAFYWNQIAALQGVPQAQTALGIMYMGGLGCIRSVSEARKWLTRAAKRGSPSARSILPVLDSSDHVMYTVDARAEEFDQRVAI